MHFQDVRKCWWKGRNSFHAIHLEEKHIQHQNSTPSCHFEFTATLLPIILLIPYPSNSKPFSPPHGTCNAITLHYPTNTHHILLIYYTDPSHNPCIFNISNTMLLLILVKITYILQAQIPHTQYISFKRKSHTCTMHVELTA